MRYVFVDCRWSLAEPGLGRRLYLEGHIPGASYLDVDSDLAAPAGGGGRHPLPAAGDFAAAASRAGIGRGVFVVAYGSPGAERLWWLLRHFGHDQCAVLDDLDAWHGPLARGEEHVESAHFVPRERGDDTISLAGLAAGLDELVVADARTADRWRGDANEIDRVPGRIPGAVSAPWMEPTPELPPGKLVAYCGSGITAAVLLHRLHLSGRDALLYPGSWSEWEQHPELPVERSR